jgi:hypothetical protein
MGEILNLSNPCGLELTQPLRGISNGNIKKNVSGE